MRIMMVIVWLSGGVCSITGTLHYPVRKIDDLHISFYGVLRRGCMLFEDANRPHHPLTKRGIGWDIE